MAPSQLAIAHGILLSRMAFSNMAFETPTSSRLAVLEFVHSVMLPSTNELEIARSRSTADSELWARSRAQPPGPMADGGLPWYPRKTTGNTDGHQGPILVAESILGTSCAMQAWGARLCRSQAGAGSRPVNGGVGAWVERDIMLTCHHSHCASALDALALFVTRDGKLHTSEPSLTDDHVLVAEQQRRCGGSAEGDRQLRVQLANPNGEAALAARAAEDAAAEVRARATEKAQAASSSFGRNGQEQPPVEEEASAEQPTRAAAAAAERPTHAHVAAGCEGGRRGGGAAGTGSTTEGRGGGAAQPSAVGSTGSDAGDEGEGSASEEDVPLSIRTASSTASKATAKSGERAGKASGKGKGGAPISRGGKGRGGGKGGKGGGRSGKSTAAAVVRRRDNPFASSVDHSTSMFDDEDEPASSQCWRGSRDVDRFKE